MYIVGATLNTGLHSWTSPCPPSWGPGVRACQRPAALSSASPSSCNRSKLRMSIFNKPASQVTEADLAELLQERAVESIRLEFKSNVPDKDETLKKLSSFANTFG